MQTSGGVDCRNDCSINSSHMHNISRLNPYHSLVCHNQLEEERVSRIKKENHMLLDKMSHIMQTSGGVDCRNDYVQKSLGSEKRQQDLLRITEEHECLLQRLSSCRPRYSVQVYDYVMLCYVKNLKFYNKYF
uniref:Si:dkey-83m22.7 n=1 Tax=Sinocyclocheilus grahami TaxID=75366 RepID=A0A672SS42_SINGR